MGLGKKLPLGRLFVLVLETDQVEDRYLLQHVQNVGEVSAALLCRRTRQAQVVQVPKPKHAMQIRYTKRQGQRNQSIRIKLSRIYNV